MAANNPLVRAQRIPFVNPRSIEILTKSWSYLFLLGIVIYFSLVGTGFFSVRNFSSILTTSTLIMLMSIGQTYVIITAGIDLSIGWTVGLSSVTTARVMRDLADSGNDIAYAMLIGTMAGLLVALIPGLVNGVLVARIKGAALHRDAGHVRHCARRGVFAHRWPAGGARLVVGIARGAARHRQRQLALLHPR